MSRTARPLGRTLGVVALLAVLAITTGWTAPAMRSSDVAQSTTDVLSASQRRVAGVAVRAASGATGSHAGARAGASAKDAADEAAASKRALDRRSVSPAQGSARPNAAPAATPKVVEARSDVRRGVRNHVWIPSLGMSYNVVLFPCTRTRPPDNYMYRWGCAGHNNVYLLGHAYSVMNGLHDAYVSGRLYVGMIAKYADGNGRIRTYRVTEWRVVDPAAGVRWAIADQPVPSMTLQTCVGSKSQWRLNVRLVATD